MTDRPEATILAVDDEPANLQLLMHIFANDDGIRIRTVSDARLALAAFERIAPDLVLLDIGMPHLDGFQVMRQLLATIPEQSFVPIIIMTADVDPGLRREALTMGAHDFLNKPFDTSEVRLRIRNFLRTRQLYVDLDQQRHLLEQRVAERTEDLQRANDALRAADRMKSDLLAMVSHEMRTPLTVIAGFTELITGRWDQLLTTQRATYVDAIRRSVSRLEAMIENLLLAAQLHGREEATPATTADTGTSTVRIDELLRRAVMDSGLCSASVQVDCAPDVAVPVDPSVLQPAVTNLLDNARKYGQPPIEVACTLDDGFIDISVRDHGEGVPEEFIDQMFERFTQASVGNLRTATGTGLGLWIARGLARAHGGELTYEPATPGALFRLRIPFPSPSSTDTERS
ncbi:MAG: hybrid sensor histidine kinase/response regulator [Actinobacteria bacterium]|nr:hybrid sensor histidine kinase/response regulator [Actinomycetota bacterium]